MQVIASYTLLVWYAHMHADTNIYASNCAHSWKIGNSICACMSTMCIYKSSYASVLSGNAVCAGWFTHVIATWALIPWHINHCALEKNSQMRFSWHGLIKYEVKVQQKHRKELRWNRLNTFRVLCAVNLCFACSTQIHKTLWILMGRHAQYLHGCLALRRCHPLQPQSPLWSETGCYRNETMRRKGRIQCSCPKQDQTSLTSCRRSLLARAW